MIDIMPVAAAIIDRNGKIYLANERFANFHGYESLVDIIGKKGTDLIVPEERADTEADEGRFQETDYTRVEHNIIRKDGSRFPAEVIITSLRDAAADRCGFLLMPKDITEQKTSEVALKESEERYRLVTEMSTDYVFKVKINEDASMTLVYVSENIVALTGRTADEISSSELWAGIIHPDDREAFIAFQKNVMATGAPGELECRSFVKGGAIRWIQILVRPILDPGTRAVTAIIGAVKDISERKKAEQRIKASLAEKETLLKEIHHRVKNNLQIITSLLGLQARYQNDDALVRQFGEAQHRIRSMALVHEKLYRSDDFARINFKSYITHLADEVMSGSSFAAPIRIRIDIEDIHVSIDQAVPCGLIVNELLTNAIKYAFPDGSCASPEISILFRCREGNAAELVVGDNGVGVPAGVEMGKTESLGLSLVPILAQQLRGTVVLDRSHGSTFTIAFDLDGRRAE